MDDATKKLVDEQIQKLPQVSRDALAASHWEEKVREIGNARGLLLDEIESLYRETLLIMIGLENPDMYLANITHHVDISKETAEAVAEEIIEKVFSPIFEDIQKRSLEATKEHQDLFDTEENTQKAPAEPKREDLLNDIENPAKSSSSITKIKLSDIFIKKPEISTHTDSSVAPETNKDPSLRKALEDLPVTKQREYPHKEADPYLEPID